MFQHLFSRVVTWFRSIRWTRTDKIAGVVAGAFLALMIACMGCAAIGNALGANTTQTAGVVASPTSTPLPMRPATPRPTSTPQPTATPRPTQDPIVIDQQMAQHLASENCGYTTNAVTATYSPADNAVEVVMTLGTQWDLSTAQNSVKIAVFDCFKGFYTSPHASFVQDTHVEVQGPVTDVYGNNSTGLYGDAELTRATASQFNWDNLDPFQAWDNNIYDSQYVRTS